MNNGVKQAGFAQVQSPQAAMRLGPRKDAADTVFADVMQFGEKGSRRSDSISATEQRSLGVEAKLTLRPTMLGQIWHNAPSADTEPATENASPDEYPGLESGALTHRKSFRPSRELQTKESAESEPEADSKKDDETADAGLALAIVEIDRAVDRKSTTATNAGETLVAAVGVTDPVAKKPAARNDRPSEAVADEAAVSSDAESSAQTGKNGRLTAIDSASPPPRPSSSAPEAQQRFDAQSGRAPVEPPSGPVRQLAREARQAEQPATNSRVDVVGSQTLPAPAIPAANTTTTAFMNAISADPVWKTSATDAVTQAALHGRPQPGMVHSLKIQLHPAELGMVTADLRFAGDQLSVVLQVETAEAYHRLNSDTDTIVKAFRALGYEIDQVAIQQPQPVSQTTRTDAAASNSAPLSRDLQSGFSGNPGGAGAGSGGRGTNGEGRNDARNADGIGSISQERSSRGLYI
jgi:chemotaxis protein MotD